MIYTSFVRKYGWAILVAACFAIFFSPLIVGNQVFFCCDNLLINIPAKVVFTNLLKDGHFLLWNPYILSGMPFLADINLSLLFPTTLLYMFISPFYALTAGALVCILFSMMGMYGLVYRLAKAKGPAIISALIWGLSGSMITYINNIPMLQVIAMMPWVVWMLFRYLAEPTHIRFIHLVIMVTASIFGGHPQIMYLTWVMMITIVLVYSDWPWRDRIIFLVKLGIYAFAVAGVQLVPFAELATLSTRVGRGFDYSSSGSLHPASVIRLVFPSIVGNSASGTSWILGGSINGYIGWIGLVLAFWPAVKKTWTYYFRILGVSSFLLALGSFTPFYKIAYLVVPGVALFRSPENFLILVTFSLSVLAGLGAVQLHKVIVATKTRNVWFGFLSLVGVSAGIAMQMRHIEILYRSWSGLLPVKVQNKLAQLGPSGISHIWQSFWQNILVEIAIAIVFLWLISKKRKEWVYAVTTALLIFVELWVFVSPTMIVVDGKVARSWFQNASKTARQVLAFSQNTQMITDPSSYPYQFPHVFGQPYWPPESAWQAQILRPNIHMIYGLSSPDGYTSMILRSYHKRLSPNSTDPTSVNMSGVSGETLRSLGVGARVTTQGVSVRGDVKVLSLAEPASVHCGGCTGISMIQQPNRIQIRLSAEHVTILETAINFYPGWEAHVDGRQEAVMSKNGFIAIPLSKGEHLADMRFKPRSVYTGIALTIAGVCGLLVLLYTQKKYKF